MRRQRRRTEPLAGRATRGRVALPLAVPLEYRPTCRRLSGIQIAEGPTAIALEHRLLAIAERHACFVAMGPGFAERPISKGEEPPALEEHIARARAVDESPDPAGGLSSPHLDAILPRLLLDLGSPLVGIVNAAARADHLPGEQQLAVVISPTHALDEPLDPPVDLDRILHSPDPTAMTSGSTSMAAEAAA
jgi:hypothetical protein